MRATAMMLALVLALTTGLFLGIMLAGPRQPRTCAVVGNGIVCWHGLEHAELSVR